MSVLRAKLAQKSTGNASGKYDVSVWDDLHMQICEQIGRLSRADVEPLAIERHRSPLKVFRKKTYPRCVRYVLTANFADAPALVVEVSPGASGMIAVNALKSDRGYKAFSDNVQSLDILLCKPIAETVLRYLIGKMMTAFPGGSMLMGEKSLDAQTLTLGPDNAAWSKLEFTHTCVLPDTEKRIEVSVNLWIPDDIFPQMPKTASEQSKPVMRPDDPWFIQMRGAVGNSQVKLRAVVDNIELSVAECTRLQIGQVIPLEGASTSAVRIETETDEGPVVIADGLLGSYKSRRALKLNGELSHEFLGPEPLL